eukprot:6953003-Pyramimonas_sp.AAC.1
MKSPLQQAEDRGVGHRSSSATRAVTARCSRPTRVDSSHASYNNQTAAGATKRARPRSVSRTSWRR